MLILLYVKYYNSLPEELQMKKLVIQRNKAEKGNGVSEHE